MFIKEPNYLKVFRNLLLLPILIFGAPLAFAELFGPSDEPSYSESDVPQIDIPLVKAKYQGQTIAVVPYVNKSLSDYSFLGDAAVGILPEYLLEAGFQPIESTGGELNSVLDEIDYGQSQRVNPSSAAQFGEHLGSKYVFLGEVSNYRVVRPKGSRSIGFGGVGINLGGGKITYDIQVSGRIVDVETRAIIASKSLSHKESFDVKGGGIVTSHGTFSQGEGVEVENEAGGEVLNTALARLMTKIVQQLNRRP